MASPARISASGATWASATPDILLSCPHFDLGTQPELDAAASEVQDRPWHVGVSMLIHADCVAVRESKQLGHAVRVEKVVEVYMSAHDTQITFVLGSVRPAS